MTNCPGYEMKPNPCTCPCYGCKHHCSAHNEELGEVLADCHQQIIGLSAENARLRAELEARRVELLKVNERHSAELSDLVDGSKHDDDLVTQLRAELDTTNKIAGQNLENYLDGVAPVQRVRAEVAKFPEAPWYHGPSIREALEGTE